MLKIITICCFCILFISAASISAERFDIKIQRESNNDRCTIGRLYVNDQFVSNTLELSPVLNLPSISSIPKGIYPAHIRNEAELSKWKIELDNQSTTPRTAIQIHTGNTPNDTQGCILVGFEPDYQKCTLKRSKEAFTKLKTLYFGSETATATPNKNITVEIQEP